MSVFVWLMLLGLVGMALTALLGVTHIGHHAGRSISPRHGMTPHPGVHHLPAVHSHAGLAKVGTKGVHQGAHTNVPTKTEGGGPAPVAPIHHFNMLGLLPSPVDIFSMCIGAGAVGVLLTGHVDPKLLTIFAVIGALVFDYGIVRPFFGFLLNFASKPSEGLEGMVALPAEALTKFDEKGQGLVRLNMEGQLVQILAKLSPDDMAEGVTVHKGDQVIVTEVDKQRNICQVTRQLSL